MLPVLRSLTRVSPATGRVCGSVVSRSYCDSVEDSTPKREERRPSMVLTGERSLNRVTLIGRLGRDPEVRGTVEKPVTILSLATSVTLRDSTGEYKQMTDWHRIALFREPLQMWAGSSLGKGDKVYISGPLRYSKFVSESSNEVVKTTSIIGDDIILLERKRRAQENVVVDEEPEKEAL